MVLVSASVTILPAAFDMAASLAPLGSAPKIRMAGLMAFAATEIPDIKPPPAFTWCSEGFQTENSPIWSTKYKMEGIKRSDQTNRLWERLKCLVEGLVPEAPKRSYLARCKNNSTCRAKPSSSYEHLFYFVMKE